MNKSEKILSFLKHPGKLVVKLAGRGYLPFISDEDYLKLKFKEYLGYPLDLSDPKTFNEKLQWLKLYDRQPEYTTMVDKVAAKQWVADRIGEEHVIPTLGVWDHFDDIDFDELPNQFVLKCTHDSGSIVIVKDKAKMDKVAARQKLEKGLKRNYYLGGREWPYKNVPRRIIAEKYMADESGIELKDYKVFNFDGEPRLIDVDFDRFVQHKRNLYSADWKYIEAAIQYPNDPDRVIDRPKSLEKMLDLARQLSKGLPHIRTDFYCIGGKVYFGEMTFYHESGFGKFDPASFDAEMGEWINLPGGYLLRSNEYIFYLHEQEEKQTPKSLTEYKVFCFNGEPKVILVCKGEAHGAGRTNDYCDQELNRLPFTSLYPRSSGMIEIPPQKDEMLGLAAKLSSGIPQLRVDLYIVSGQVYIGELTFFHNSGFCSFEPPEWDVKLGEWIQLPKKEVS